MIVNDTPPLYFLSSADGRALEKKGQEGITMRTFLEMVFIGFNQLLNDFLFLISVLPCR